MLTEPSRMCACVRVRVCVRARARAYTHTHIHTYIHTSLLGLEVQNLKSGKTLSYNGGNGKSKAIPVEAWSGPEGSRKLKLPDFMTVGT
jgi:hypothetical protein